MPDWTIIQENDDLEVQLREMIRSGPPRALEVRSDKSVLRLWRSKCPAQLSKTDVAEIILRHPELLYGPLREVGVYRVGRSPRSRERGRRGKYQSKKMSRTMRAASDLEFDYLADCEVNPDVRAFVEQPMKLRLRGSIGRGLYTPDFLVLSEEGPKLVEIKFEEEASERELESLWPWLGEAVTCLGFSFEVLTERHIRRRPRFETINRLQTSRHFPCPGEMAAAVCAYVRATGSRTIRQIVSQFATMSELNVHYLLLRAYLIADLDKEIGLETIVRPNMVKAYGDWS